MSDLLEIGYVIKTHGVKGHLRISFLENVKPLSENETLFFFVKGNTIPFFIKEISYFKNGDALILLEDIFNKEEAGTFARKKVLGNHEYFLENNSDEEEINYLNYLIVDEKIGELGFIIQVLHTSEYDLIEIKYKNKNVIIPLANETIISVDDEKKIIKMKLPDGILDV